MFGVLNVHKPPDVTSRDVVNLVQRAVRPAKVGHAGTLDPMATGVLLVCLGKATKLISLLQDSPKIYEADFQFGQTSDTDDSTGTIQATEFDGAAPDEQMVRTALEDFVGEIQQVPPAYSAVKVAGKRAYALARKGQEFELTAKPVVIHELEVLQYAWPKLTLRIKCGSGTYIRSIARDLGVALGCGALMSRLVRTSIGSFDLSRAVTPEQLEADGVERHINDPVSVTASLARYLCNPEEMTHIRSGRPFSLRAHHFIKPAESVTDSTRVALTSMDQKTLLAFAELKEEGAIIQPRTVFME